MKVRYFLQKILGYLLDGPIIPAGKSVGYSLVRSEKYAVKEGDFVKIDAPFFLHKVEIGDYSYLSVNSRVSNTVIGKFSSIGPNFCSGLGIHPTDGISTSPMFYSTARQNGTTLCGVDKVKESKLTVIGNDVFIGANVTVLDGVHIADGAVVGAGAVVVSDIPPYSIAVGVPARVVKYRFDDDVIKSLLEKQWWNGTDDDIKEVERCFWNVNAFLKGTK